jgi:hypothetical protein
VNQNRLVQHHGKELTVNDEDFQDDCQVINPKDYELSEAEEDNNKTKQKGRGNFKTSIARINSYLRKTSNEAEVQIH